MKARCAKCGEIRDLVKDKKLVFSYEFWGYELKLTRSERCICIDCSFELATKDYMNKNE
jgi:hypothetical protein